jgi:hypothetical protein
VNLTLQVDPEQATAYGQLEVRDYQDQPVCVISPIRPHPWKQTLPAGNYQINVVFNPPRPPYRNYTRLRYVKPTARTRIDREVPVMSKLNFQLVFKSSELQSLDLPVEVRKPNPRLVKKTFSSKSVDLSPGKYFVSMPWRRPGCSTMTIFGPGSLS